MVPEIKTLQFRCVLIESNQALVRTFNPSPRTLSDRYPGSLVLLTLSNYSKSIFHLLLIYNHAIADGISGVILTHQILENYTKLKKNETLDMTSTRVKTIGELKSEEMPSGDANIQKLTDYANKVSRLRWPREYALLRIFNINTFLGKWRIWGLLGGMHIWFKRKRKFYH